MKLTPEELVSAIEAEERQSLDAHTGELRAQRDDALARYRGELYGNEVEGRSAVVDKSVADTIEWIMPSLLRVYMGGEDVGQFEARGPEDEEAAKIETDVINFYLSKSDMFSQISATIRDALLLKNGYTVAYWSKRFDTMTETYASLAPEEAAMLAEDPEVTIVEHTEVPDAMGSVWHDIKIERKTADEYPAVESIPPDEMLVSRRHRWTSLADADFVQWRRKVTIGQLRSEGFKVDDDAPEGHDWDSSGAERDRFGNIMLDDDETGDPVRRLVLCKDTYIRMDLRGDGTAQLWRVVIIDGQTEPILQEEADVIPFAAFVAVIYPHSHVGTSVYDQIADLALIKTTLLRQYLDGVYLANSGQKAVDVGRVNLDDLLVSRPGGIVRVEGNPGDAIMPLVSADVTSGVLQGLQYIDAAKEQRTGVRAWTEGLAANSLHPTATGVQSVDSAAAQRIELIARTLASGFRDLMCIVHALVSKHSQKPIQVKLKNEWRVIDPRAWKRRTDFVINVGLGVGTPDAQMAKLNGLAPMLGQAMQLGLAGPQEAYNYGVEVIKAAGFRSPDKFLHAPQTDPQTGQPVPPPQKDDPLVQAQKIKSEADAKKAQMEMQNEQQKFQAEQQGKMQEMQMQAQMKEREQMGSLELQRSNDERQYQLDLQKHAAEQSTELQIAQLQSATSIEVAKISRGVDDGLVAAQQVLDAMVDTAARISGGMHEFMPQMQQVLQAHVEAMAQHAASVNGKRRH